MTSSAAVIRAKLRLARDRRDPNVARKVAANEPLTSAELFQFERLERELDCLELELQTLPIDEGEPVPGYLALLAKRRADWIRATAQQFDAQLAEFGYRQRPRFVGLKSEKKSSNPIPVPKKITINVRRQSSLIPRPALLERLRAWRLNNVISQAKAAARIGVSASGIVRFENSGAATDWLAVSIERFLDRIK